MWMNPEISVAVNQNHKLLLNRIKAASSAAVSNRGAYSLNALSSHIPTVSFDLGDEWDDFDDENLVHASETSLASCLTSAKPEAWQCVYNNMPGGVELQLHVIERREVIYPRLQALF